MTRTAVVTGSSSGIGAATKRALEADGFSVFGIDLHGADLDADLGTTEGRARAISHALEFCDGTLDALIPCAGLSGLPDRPGSLLASINYFGTVDLILGLKAALQASGAASVVAISSNSTTIQPGVPMAVVDACLRHDEALARSTADAASSLASYPATKTAIAWWIRSQAVDPSWVDHGAHLNALAPGMIETAMVAEGRADPTIGKFFDLLPIPRGRTGRPEEVAALIALLCSPLGRNFVGSILSIDGGTDALLRTRDWPKPMSTA